MRKIRTFALRAALTASLCACAAAAAPDARGLPGAPAPAAALISPDAQHAVEALSTPARALISKHPGARLAAVGDRITMVYGRAMGAAPDTHAAADLWLDEHAEVFGAGSPDLRLARTHELFSSPKTVLVYEQFMDGLPVERSSVRVIVHDGADARAVVSASARLVPRPRGGFAPDRLDAAQAVEAVIALPQWAAIQEFSEPEMVVYAGEGDEEIIPPALRAWKFNGLGMGIDGVPIRYSFFVDAATGALAHARNEIHHGSADVSGTVTGMGSPGTLPDIPANPPAPLPIPEIRAQIAGGNNAFTGTGGAFTIDNALPGPLNVSSSVAFGRWVAVSTNQGSLVTGSVGVNPPGPADILLNPSPAQFTTAQINAFVHQTLAHNYFRDRAPGFAALDTAVPANVNLSSVCNAFYDAIANTTNFFNAGTNSQGANCVNSAYSTVVAHEYGHHIVNRLGLAQGAFGEGFSDTISMLLYDDPIIGNNFFTNRTPNYIRNPPLSTVSYPCPQTSGSHACGQILGALWWSIRQNFGAAYGEPLGLELARQLQVDWALVTQGGIGLNSAHPQTAIEVLTVDDDDADLTNGTPNYTLICDAFAARGIACPALPAAIFSYPEGFPFVVLPTGAATLRAVATGIAGPIVPGTGKLFISANLGPFVEVAMGESAAGEYTGLFPALPCGAALRYFVQTEVDGVGVVNDPVDAPASWRNAVVGYGQVMLLEDDIESDTGWQAGAPGDTAIRGQWVRVNPIGTFDSAGNPVQPDEDHTPPPGEMCFVTGQGTPGGTLGEADVDDGFTTLITPPFDLTNAPGAVISYWRWYSNHSGANPFADVFTVDVTSDGVNWVNVEVVGPAGPQVSGGWFQHSFVVGNLVTPSSTVRVRFIADDAGAGSLVEAAVDDLRIDIVDCTPPVPCPGDADGDGDVDFNDVTSVLANFGGPGPLGDADGNGIVNFADLTTVLAFFGTVCP